MTFASLLSIGSVRKRLIFLMKFVQVILLFFISEFSFLDKDKGNKRGRPFGDKCWVIANHIKVKSHDVLNNDVMVLEIDNGSGHSVYIIGVWFPFDDNSYDRLANIQSNISLLETFLTQHENEQVFIIGDFNCNLKRNKRFDKIFNNFILKNNMFDCIDLFEQQ